MKGRIVIRAELCKECDMCMKCCKQGRIKKEKKYNAKGYLPAVFEDPEGKCTACRICALVCPEVAIEVYGE